MKRLALLGLARLLPGRGRERPDRPPDTSRSATQSGPMRHWHRRPAQWVELPALTPKVTISCFSSTIGSEDKGCVIAEFLRQLLMHCCDQW
jgi:hypothetical protein